VQGVNILLSIMYYRVKFIFQSFPPVHSVRSHCSVGEDGVGLESCHCHCVGLPVCSGTDTKESILRINATQLALFIESHPCNVIT